MNSEYILSGDPAELRRVIQENRIRISRGLVSFTPRQTLDDKETEPLDDKDVEDLDDKKPKKTNKKKA